MADLTGITGKIARVDLTKGTVETIETPVDVYKKFLGGSALGTYYLMKEGIYKPEVKPLSPENMIQFMIGPATGAAPNAPPLLSRKAPTTLSASQPAAVRLPQS